MKKFKKNKWTGSAEDFVEFVRFIETMEMVFHAKTRKPATREEIAEYLLSFTEVDFGHYADFKTLDLCCKGNDFLERTFEMIHKIISGEIDPPKHLIRFPRLPGNMPFSGN